MNEPTLLTADPGASFRAHADEIRAAIERVLASGHYILGPEVAAFEGEFAAYQGGGETVAVANGTEAIELALRAVGIGPGDRVATVANTVSATAAAIQQIGAQPVWVEIDPATMLMSPEALDQVLTQRGVAIKAVVPVHLYGQIADMARIATIAHAHGVRIVEDCAQAHGAARAGRKAGTWGDIAAFSFYPTKNLGAIGDGGAVFSQSHDLAERVRLLRQYGWKERYVSSVPGRNSRLDEIQAAILRVKLRHLDAENAVRRQLAARYADLLGGMAAHADRRLRLPVASSDSLPVWHQYAVRSTARDALRGHLAARGVAAAVLYPVPLHRQPAYAEPDLTLPETERACAEVLCLPLHPGLQAADIDRVGREILAWAAQ